ncbi:MAG: hypothetical protein K2J37_06175 [Ruminococcus sp.]|nr:hypothetical protein [Ruminococcus sp.]
MLYAGNEFKLNIISPDGVVPQIYWVESSDYNIAQCVDNSIIKLYKEGTVTLTAHCSGNLDIPVTITISSEPPATLQTTSTEIPAATTAPITTAASQPVDEYTLGDIDNDGKIDASDASAVLVAYSRLSTGLTSGLDNHQSLAADVNFDKKIDSTDASKILSYYAVSSTGGTPSWDNI